jgi:hypothetical protein
MTDRKPQGRACFTLPYGNIKEGKTETLLHPQDSPEPQYLGIIDCWPDQNRREGKYNQLNGSRGVLGRGRKKLGETKQQKIL